MDSRRAGPNAITEIHGKRCVVLVWLVRVAQSLGHGCEIGPRAVLYQLVESALKCCAVRSVCWLRLATT